MVQTVERTKTKVRGVSRTVADNVRHHWKAPLRLEKLTTLRSLLLFLAHMKHHTPEIATDEHFSGKSITYSLSKTSPYILSAGERSSAPRNFLCFQYAHISKAFIVERVVDPFGRRDAPEGHLHSFYRDGNDYGGEIEVEDSAGKDNCLGKVTAGINDLLVLKSTGYAFENFYRDEYTALAEVNDKSNCKATPDVRDSVVSYFDRETVAFIDS